jgi:hypothetical protein
MLDSSATTSITASAPELFAVSLACERDSQCGNGFEGITSGKYQKSPSPSKGFAIYVVGPEA